MILLKQDGAEFPIRFDFLDTIDGGNLSLQVHPLKEYIREKFGMAYTQDESYYMLDAREGAYVYLGLKSGIELKEMTVELTEAQNGKKPFDADKFVNKIPINRSCFNSCRQCIVQAKEVWCLK